MASRSLWPREHGAYFQLAIPLVASLAMRVPTVAAGALATAACGIFVAHESLLVVLGNRGRRAVEIDGARARRWLNVLAGGSAAIGIAGLVLAPGQAFAIASTVVVAGVIVVGFAARRREHTLAGELAAAVALTGASASVSCASGGSTADAVVLWLAWSIGFGASVIAVHRVIARHKRAATSLDALLLVGLIAIDTACIVAHELVPVPLVTAATVLVIAPPKASHLRAIGVAIAVLAASSAVVAVISSRNSVPPSEISNFPGRLAPRW